MAPDFGGHFFAGMCQKKMNQPSHGEIPGGGLIHRDLNERNYSAISRK